MREHERSGQKAYGWGRAHLTSSARGPLISESKAGELEKPLGAGPHTESGVVAVYH